MEFDRHYDFGDDHAFLSPSKYHWVNYDDEKLEKTYHNWNAAKHGTRLHDFAKECIQLGQKLPRSQQTLHMFVNDAIGYKMTPEQGLFYSPNCFGTADAISFRRDFLRIHDYKSGVTRASIVQLEIYAAIFCLEYDVDPDDIEMELRIYQSDEVVVYNPKPERIKALMEAIVRADKKVSSLK